MASLLSSTSDPFSPPLSDIDRRFTWLSPDSADTSVRLLAGLLLVVVVLLLLVVVVGGAVGVLVVRGTAAGCTWPRPAPGV